MPQFDRMTDEDVPLVLAIEQASFTDAWTRLSFHHLLRQDQFYRFWVARGVEAMPPIVAYAGASLAGDVAEIVNIAIHPDWRRKGLGQWFLLRVLEEIREHGEHTVLLDVRRSNLPAQTLYRKLGFVEFDVRKRYYRDNNEDAIEMMLIDLHEEHVWSQLAAMMGNVERRT